MFMNNEGLPAKPLLPGTRLHHRTAPVRRRSPSLSTARISPTARILVFAFAATGSFTASAHDFTFTDVCVVLRADATFDIDLTVDVDALALGVPQASDSAVLAQTLRQLPPDEFSAAVEQARQTVLRRVRVRFDDAPVRPEVAFPHYNTAIAELAAIPTVLGTTVRLTGRIPDGAANFTFGASRAFNALHVTILEQPTGTSAKHVLGAGEDAPPFRLNQPPDAARRAASPGRTFARYLVLGFEHILPHGLDHILFVLGLFLLSPKVAPLLWQVTAFTVAHSITLGLAAFNVVSLPPSVVEPLIALSITYVAVENVLTSNLKRWRPAVVFAFGLLHGLGFAGVLADIGLPRGEYMLALAAFNLGVEAGQAAVIALAFLAVGAFRQRTWYRRAVIVPASVLIAAVGAWWTVERLL
ncbi:MAG: hypothetical protein FLDDKLPJ_01571 [Phycisphaerae bacterium]|nr:hypothetical protein [Phycisphaerae bacterium]